MREKPAPISANTVEAALGNVSEWAIQSWVKWSGRKVRTSESRWLEGPVGDEYIGAGFYIGYAREAGLRAVVDDEGAGLLPNFDVLAGQSFDPSLVRPEIRDFYERTARYDLDVRVAWSGLFKHPPRTLIYLVGRNVGQFDIPLSTSAVAMENELIRLEDPLTGEAPTSVGSGARRLPERPCSPASTPPAGCRWRAAGSSRASIPCREGRRP
jgi:hypothetical protein